MTLRDMIEELELCPLHLTDELDVEVSAPYCGDLLSDVLAHIPPQGMWLTIQGHVNIIAVAQLRDVACVVLVNGMAPDPQTIAKAKLQEINLCGSEKTSAELCMRLANML
ncbi:MAG: iron-sulfur binding hydrogenase [Lentisphaerae bacterium]|jgi:hypothetical protein|nr:iron-sulfur binding hydrogenase [Lentisphaerota bacterium]MBT4819580.1 iron-sulfur binding hydrogenase [Lentisphaerota bacterium]MBT5609668.1 iron-sulfur binding hydrogenase [Lentisphaerota bacterium]MBT7059935.1 iron-sulfur binding hydrogenase [Lentisphaerota bacterium]MBT7841384.1 iron-sulfur binding hydrogenase [Lentisphaerota bacterium]